MLYGTAMLLCVPLVCQSCPGLLRAYSCSHSVSCLFKTLTAEKYIKALYVGNF